MIAMMLLAGCGCVAETPLLAVSDCSDESWNAHHSFYDKRTFGWHLSCPDGTAQSGQKSFLLEVFDAASGGSLLYREDVGNITLGDGGVYSFQFGATGTSNTQVTINRMLRVDCWWVLVGCP